MPPPPPRRIIPTFRPSCPMETPKPRPHSQQRSETRDSPTTRVVWVLPVSFSISSCLTGNCKRSPQEGRGILAFAHHHRPPTALESGWLGRLRLSLRYHAFSRFVVSIGLEVGRRLFFWFWPMVVSIRVAETNGNDNPKSLWWSRGVGCRIQQVPNSNADEHDAWNIMKMLMGVCDAVRNHPGERHVGILKVTGLGPRGHGPASCRGSLRFPCFADDALSRALIPWRLHKLGT